MQARVFGQMLAVACYMEVFTRVAIAEPRKVCHSSYATTRQTTRVTVKVGVDVMIWRHHT